MHVEAFMCVHVCASCEAGSTYTSIEFQLSGDSV